jgi:hypothetical protein
VAVGEATERGSGERDGLMFCHSMASFPLSLRTRQGTVVAKYCLLPSSGDDGGVVAGCKPVYVFCNARFVRGPYGFR